MARTSWLLLGVMVCVAVATSVTTQAENLPVNEMPMYGGVEKSPQQKAADQKFINSVPDRTKGAVEAVRLGWSYFRKGDIATAIKRFNQAWLLNPENGDAYHGFAVITSIRDNRQGEAEKYFLMALSKPVVCVCAHVDYGRLLWKTGRFDASIEQLNNALDIDQKAFNARSNIAFVHYLRKDFGEACEWAERARENRDELERGFLEFVCGTPSPSK